MGAGRVSRTNHPRRYRGDWWAKRPLSTGISHDQSDTKWWKRLLHKKERRQANDWINEQEPTDD